jgi:hypothetical protein
MLHPAQGYVTVLTTQSKREEFWELYKGMSAPVARFTEILP